MSKNESHFVAQLPTPQIWFFWPFYKLYHIFLTRNKHKEQHPKTIHIHLHHVLDRVHQTWCSHKGQCFHHWLILLHELGQAKVCYVCLEGVGIKKNVSSLCHNEQGSWVDIELQELGGTIRVQTLTRRGFLMFPMAHSVPFRFYQAIFADNLKVLSLLSLNRYGNMKTFVSSDLNDQRGRSSNRAQTRCKLRTMAVCLLLFFFTWNCRWQECPFFIVLL